MEISMFTQPKMLNPEEALFLQDDFDLVLGGPHRFEVFQALHRYFNVNPMSERQKFYRTYWQWYVRLACAYVAQLDEDTFVRVIELTVPTAMLLDIDIEEQFFYYLHRAVPYGKEQEAVFRHVRSMFEQSTAPLNIFNPNGMTLESVYAQAATLRGREETDIQLAEYYAAVERELFASETAYPDVTPKEKLPIVRRLVEFVFFFSIDHDISQIVWDHYEQQNDVLDEDAGSRIFETPPRGGLSHKQIYELIDARFLKNAEGQYENVSGVLALLDALAEEYGDPQVRELFFYDEVRDRFTWNDTLIK